MSRLRVFVILFISLLLISQVQCDLTSDIRSKLGEIAKAYGFQWGSQSNMCGQSGFVGNRQTRSSITCNSSKQLVLKLVIDAQPDPNTQLCYKSNSDLAVVQYNNNGWKTLNGIKSITFYNAFIPTYFVDLYSISTLEELIYDGGGLCTMQYGGSTNTLILPAGQTLYINGLEGTFPTLSPNLFFVNISQANGTTLSTNFDNPTGWLKNLFNTKLISFETYLYTKPSGPTQFDFTNYQPTAPNLRTFSLSAPSYAIKLNSFFNLSSNLQDLNLYNVAPDVKAFPSMSVVTWNQLNTLTLQNMGLTGNVDPALLDSNRFVSLNLRLNPQLNVSISNNFGTSSTIKRLNIANTMISSPLPSNILSKGLVFLDVRNCPGLVNTTLPLAFLCMPPAYLVDDGTDPSYLIDDTYENYKGPNTPRNCSIVLNPITPNPMPANESMFSLTGQNLAGDSFSVVIDNRWDPPTQMICPATFPSSLLCYNVGFLQGQGTLNLTVKIGATQNTISRPFSFVPPSITSVSSAPTLGGTITIRGYDLLSVRPYDNRKPMVVTINGVECLNITIISPLLAVSCYYPPGVQSGMPVSVNVKGVYNKQNESPLFSYLPPTVQSSVAVEPNVASQLLITGVDFWNETSLVNVTIGTTPPINCPVLTVNHTYLTCSFPATPFTAGSRNLIVNVNGQNSQPNNLFGFVDTAICPKSCNTDTCDVGIGFCNCRSSFGPACDQTPATSSPTVSNTTFPVLRIQSPLNANTYFDAYIVSIIEDDAETFITSWNGTNIDNTTWSYIPSGGKALNVIIRSNNASGQDTIGGSTLNHPADSYSYLVSYTAPTSVKSLKFRFALDIYPVECKPAPSHLAYPSGSQNNSLRWVTVTKYNVDWFARFPMAVSINNNADSGILQSSVDTVDGLQTRLLVQVVTNSLISSSTFAFDFSALTATTPRIPEDTSACTPIDPNNPGAPNNPAGNDKWKVTVGVVVGVVGAAIIGVGAFFIVKQQRKLNVTKSLLDKKLRELSVNQI